MTRHRQRPSGIAFEVYDPWDGQMIVRHEYRQRWDANMAAQGKYSRHIRKVRALVQTLGRPDGKSLGLRKLRTRTTLLW